MWYDAERGRVSDDPSTQSRSVRAHLADLHRRPVDAERTLLYRLSGVLHGHDVEARLDGSVRALVVVVDL